MTTKAFWASTAERVVRTFAWTLGSLLLTGATGILDANWIQALSASGMAALLALLGCVAGQQISGDGPSFNHTETLDSK